MLFNSYSFILVFLPVVWILYVCAQRISWRLASPVLAIASLFFYSWWDLRFLPLLLGSIGVNFLIGRWIEGAIGNEKALTARSWMIFGITLNLAALGFFKYVNFFLDNVAALTGESLSTIQVVLPIGISFFTFQQIAYLIDVRHGNSKRYKLADYSVFVSFFPQLIAGPIVHHREMMPQFERRIGITANDMALGISIFVVGLFKKVFIADNLAQFATPIFAAADGGSDITMMEAWGGTLAYTFQIYFDFSGYSDMAIGLGRMFGIKLPINFYSPYRVSSIVEFWRCWHITLSRFLRDYLYISLGGNRHGALRRYGNLFATMLLGGLWHGAGWGFVIWGGLHGIYLCVNHALLAAAKHSNAIAAITRQRWIGWLATFLAVVFAWVFFRATTLDGALAIASAMLGADGLTLPGNYAVHLGTLPEHLGFVYSQKSFVSLGDWAFTGIPFVLAAAAIALWVPNTGRIFLSNDPFYSTEVIPVSSAVLSWRPGLPQAAVISLLLACSMLFASTISEFLYFQF